MSMEMDLPIYEKIKPKGNCYGYFKGIILPTKLRDVVVTMGGKPEVCHPVLRIIFHSIN